MRKAGTNQRVRKPGSPDATSGVVFNGNDV